MPSITTIYPAVNSQATDLPGDADVMRKSVYDPDNDGNIAITEGGTGASNATDARTNLGLGTISTQNANSVAITGGSVAGITDLAVADGGTGASTAADARTNLDAAQSTWTQNETGATARTVNTKLRDLVTTYDFGAVGDGVVDDTAALQAALDANRLVVMLPGKYRITSDLIVDPIRNRGCGFIGLASIVSRYPYTQQSGGPAWTGTDEAIIFYDGTTSTSACCIRASAEAVGTEPTSTFVNTIWSFCLQNITLDANSKAGYGLYTARVQDLQLEGVNARGATVAGISLNGTYSGCVKSVHVHLNSGRGFELGAADTRWGWTVNDQVNALHIYQLHADANGSGATFREGTPSLIADNCGVYFGPHRGCFVYGVVSENNFGANIVIEPSSGGNVINGVYTELGSSYAPGGAGTDAVSLGYATRQNGIIFIGAAGALNCGIRDGNMTGDYIWLTGISPTATREESAFFIENIANGAGTVADWGNYRFVNCSSEIMTVTGTSPAGAYTIKGGLQFGAGEDILTYYDEGSFTPSLIGATNSGTGWTYTLQTGSYTRIGNRVFFNGRIVLSAKSGDATGSIYVSGLPFTIPNSNTALGSVSISNANNFTTSIVSVEGVLNINSTAFSLRIRTAASASDASTTLADLSDTTQITFMGHYRV